MQETEQDTPDNTSDTKPSNTEQEQNKDIVRYDDWGNEIRD